MGKYKSYKEWKLANPKEYQMSRDNGWTEEICRINKWEYTIYRPSGYWHIKKNVINEAKKHKSVSDWRKSSSRSVFCSVKYGWYGECIKFFPKKKHFVLPYN